MTNVSILGGFLWDTPFNGMSFVQHAGRRAQSLCRELAERVWQGRGAYCQTLPSTIVCDGVERGVDPRLGRSSLRMLPTIPERRGNTSWL